MLTWTELMIVAALSLVAGGALYMRLRWRHAPQAFRAMLVIAACYFVAGSLVGAWVIHLATPSLREKPVAQPTPFALASNTPEASQLVGYRCGSDRWPVKTLSDLDADKVNLTPVRSTVSALVSTSRPQGVIFRYDHRVAPVELTTYVVHAVAVKFKGEEDHDTHVIVVDPNDFTKSMVTEFVDWGCAGAVNSRARAQFKQAYEALSTIFSDYLADSPKMTLNGKVFVLADLLGYRPTFTDLTTGKKFLGPNTDTPPPELVRYATVEITGVGYWDDEHGVEGAAPNSIELHPILSIRRLGSDKR
jgi:hypothetical protein